MANIVMPCPEGCIEPVYLLMPAIEWMRVRAIRTHGLNRGFTHSAAFARDRRLEMWNRGNTEAGRPSRRTGVEWTNYFSPKPWLTFDADFAFSKARFTDFDVVGDQIPGAARTVISAGASAQDRRHIFGSLRWRYVGTRPLIEDNTVRSTSTSLLNGDIG